MNNLITRYQQLKMIRRAEYLARVMFEIKQCLDSAINNVNDLKTKMQGI
jgi:oligoribonuclease NrnB/cAMP/cGMP phosphodiesterase (DHH superfamily)